MNMNVVMRSKDPTSHDLTARDVMTAEVIFVGVDDAIADAAELLLDARITGAPVIDRWGNAVGVFSLTNAADHTTKSELGKTKPVKKPQVPDAVGGKSATDFDDDEAFYRFDLLQRKSIRVAEPLKDCKVGDIMTPRVHSVPDDSPVSHVVTVLLDRGIHRIFVRDADNKLVGIITSMDLLRVLDDLLNPMESRTDA